MEGFLRLRNFRDTYGEIDGSILPYLSKWLADYVIYYELDANLLADTPQVLFDRSVTVLEYIREQEEAKVICAVKQLSPKWLSRSKFYGEYRADCDTVIVRVLRRVSEHCAARCKRSFTEQYFGSCREYQVRLFDTAVFCGPLKKRGCDYAVDERCVLGKALRDPHACPKGANVSFVKLMGKDEVKAVTYERGVEDFTLACGTGCGSIVTALTLMGLVSGENVRVSMPGGELSVSLTRDGDTARDVYLTGPTCVVFEGETKEI